MANYHLRIGLPDANAYQVIFHVPIPNVNNVVGVNYRTALVRSGLGGTTIMAEGNAPGLITTAEKNSIVSGALYEYVSQINTNPGETDAQLQARLDAMYTAFANVNQPLLQGLQHQLKYFGFDRTVT
jgi:hypothetical protein